MNPTADQGNRKPRGNAGGRMQRRRTKLARKKKKLGGFTGEMEAKNRQQIPLRFADRNEKQKPRRTSESTEKQNQCG
jgi:hypothetical protein